MIGLMTVRRHRARMAVAEHISDINRRTAIVRARADGAESARKNAAQMLRARAATRRTGPPRRRLSSTEAAIEALLAAELDEVADLIYIPAPTLSAPTSEES